VRNITKLRNNKAFKGWWETNIINEKWEWKFI